jgi:hypothetical protein
MQFALIIATMMLSESAAAQQVSTVGSTASAGITMAVGASSTTTERVRITQTGNVGVGLTNPSRKLEVSGTISASTVYSGGGLVGVPVGVIVPWHKSMSNVPTLPPQWVECNGQTISDAQSPMNGQTLPNLNGQVYGGGRGYYLRGGVTSGGFNNSSYVTSNAAKYQFGTGSGTYYGIGYGEINNTESGNVASYSTTDSTLGAARFQVAAMTMVYIIKIKN